MYRLSRLVAICALLAPCHSVAEQPFLMGGIQVHEPDHGIWTDALRDSGMNTVAVTVYAHQGDWDTDNLWWSADEPAVIDEIRAARAAGLRVALIVRVALDHSFPRNEFVWHGMIMPRDDAALASWFEKYTRFVTKWAAVAQAEGVDLFGIGSEMNALNATLRITRGRNIREYCGFYWYHRLYRRWLSRNGDEIERRHLWVRGRENYDSLGAYLDKRFRVHRDWARQVHFRGQRRVLSKVNARRARLDALWVELIGHVRERYDGLVTYAANFDSYMSVGFWEHLDVMGINGYFPLREASVRELTPAEEKAVYRDSWREILERIDGFRQRRRLGDMPLVFTELGYTARRHTTVQPWSHGSFSIVGWKAKKRLLVWDDQPLDPGERLRAVEALRQVHEERGRSPLAGILYWKLSSDARHTEIEPFVLHIGPDSTDPLVEALAGFVAREDPS